ncbi:hypothetical protein ABZZ79_34890 [Streptomyces sp. NPDC006458]|uniref:hypothetical protein n=1 Tax=Streptomyces sp. NPDC006458 TaxID=3154302 RepID=UPI0033BA29B8
MTAENASIATPSSWGMELAAYDGAQVMAYLDELFRGCSGRIALAHQGPGLRNTGSGLQEIVKWTEDGTFRGPGEASAKVRKLYARQQPSTYVRMTTVREGVESGTRGVEADTAEAVCLWADIDIAGPGHKTVEQLPPDLASALRLLDVLPKPTLIVHSGGGIYPLWVFEEPLVVTSPDVLREAKALSMAWQLLVQRISARHGWTYGTGVGDLSRVLRVPGTVNPKVPGNPRPCRVLHNGGPRYVWGDLAAWVRTHSPDLVAEAEERSKPSPSVWAGGWGDAAQLMSANSPFQVLTETATFGDVLFPAGWTLIDIGQDGVEYWQRPGGSSSPYSAKAYLGGVPTLVVWSESAGLPVGEGQKLTIGRVLAQLHCDGDESRTTRGLLSAARRDMLAPDWAAELPEHVLDALRERCTSPAEVERPRITTAVTA